MLTMIHPEIETAATVVDAGVYNAVWAVRGWVLLAEPEAYATEVLGQTVKNVNDLKVTELRALISTRPGQDFPASGVRKDELVEIFRGTFPEQDPVEVEAEEAAIAAGLPVADPVVPVPDPTAPVTVDPIIKTKD